MFGKHLSPTIPIDMTYFAENQDNLVLAGFRPQTASFFATPQNYWPLDMTSFPSVVGKWQLILSYSQKYAP